jgi:hypothetical protein
VLNLLKLADGIVDIGNELWFDISSFSLGGPHTLGKFDEDELKYLKEVYSHFFMSASLSGIPNFYDKYASVECAGEQYGSQFSRSHSFSFKLAV